MMAGPVAPPQALGGTVGTARSPERVEEMRSIEAQSTAARSETKDDKVRTFHALLMPISPDKATHLYKASPVLPTEEEPHVTLGIIDASVDHDLLLGVVERWAEKTEPFDLNVGPLTSVFENGESRPFVVDAFSVEMHAARDSLKADLAEAGIHFTGYGADDWSPHMTISYLAPGAPTPDLDPPVAIKEIVSTVELSWAEGPSTNVRLGR
jgi:2'-5' RNA ligase